MYDTWSSGLIVSFIPNKTEGGGGGRHDGPLDISRVYSATRKALAMILYDNFISSFSHILTPTLRYGGTVPKVRYFLYMHVRPKKAQKLDFVYKINAN